MQIELGKSMREKFGYLIVSGLFIFFSTMTFKMLITSSGLVAPEFLEAYDLFYSIAGVMLGFLLAQIFIRSHIKQVRLGRI
jgi:uncharacterized membrane protein YqjE